METNEFAQNEGQEAKAMELSAQSVIYLNETRKWTIFFSILGFIFIGIMIIVALFMGTIFSTLSGNTALPGGMGVIMGIAYLGVAALYFFPIYYLYKFSVLSKKAIYEENSEGLTTAFKYLKSHYKFIGILTIVLLSIYFLIFLIAMIAGGISALM